MKSYLDVELAMMDYFYKMIHHCYSVSNFGMAGYYQAKYNECFSLLDKATR